jgi:predicted AAA+ superfamily ATPase
LAWTIASEVNAGQNTFLEMIDAYQKNYQANLSKIQTTHEATSYDHVT